MTINVDEFLRFTLQRLGQHYETMALAFDQPKLVAIISKSFFRHAKRFDALLCFPKGVKLCCTLNAPLILLQSGYCQEVCALLE